MGMGYDSISWVPVPPFVALQLVFTPYIYIFLQSQGIINFCEILIHKSVTDLDKKLKSQL